MNDILAVKLWVGIDAGKAHHWACAIDADGRTLWSQKIANDEAAILDAIEQILGRVW